LLVEVGLGIDRRLNEARVREGQAMLRRDEVSFWYIANHLGRRFRAEAERLFGGIAPVMDGLWRWTVLDHPVFLMSSDGVAVEPETVPVHLLYQEPEAVKLQLTEVVLSRPGWWDVYGPYLLLLHPYLLQEIERMATRSGIEPNLSLKPLIDYLGWARVAEQMDLLRVIDMVGLKRVVDEVGLKRVVDEVGLKRVVDEAGPQRVLEELLPKLTAEELEALKKRLEKESRPAS
jgi:hypothetical protein